MKRRKIFIISTIVLAVIIAAVGLFMTSKLNKTDSSLLNNKNRSLNVLLIGGDDTSKNTDTIMVVSYDQTTSKINILSIPRDTRVTIQNRDRKINFAYPFGGSEALKDTISTLLDLKIDKYIYLDLSAFREIIDTLGGVEYTVPVDMKYDDDAQDLHVDLKAGRQILDGEKAEQFMRFRHPNTYEGLPEDYVKYYNGSDVQRVRAQQSFFKELISQKATVSNLPKVIKSLDIIFDKIKTDFTLVGLLNYVKDIKSIDLDNVNTFVLSGEEKTINSIWYYDFNQKIRHNGELFNADEIVKAYFGSNTGS